MMAHRQSNIKCEELVCPNGCPPEKHRGRKAGDNCYACWHSGEKTILLRRRGAPIQAFMDISQKITEILRSYKAYPPDNFRPLKIDR